MSRKVSRKVRVSGVRWECERVNGSAKCVYEWVCMAAFGRSSILILTLKYSVCVWILQSVCACTLKV